MHNSFDVTEKVDGWAATSHNFPHISVTGASENEAINALVRAVLHFKDNYPVQFEQSIKDRAAKGLECNCGVKLREAPIGVYKGKVK